jgi:gas vesicle protein
MGTGKMLLGLLAGISTGALVGILFAPGKGSSTRRRISQRSEEYLNELGVKFDEFIDGISTSFESAKKDAIHMAEKGNATLEKAEGKFLGAAK